MRVDFTQVANLQARQEGGKVANTCTCMYARDAYIYMYVHVNLWD